MQEIEVKILEIDPEQITQKLEELGATKSFEGEIHAMLFDYPDERLKKVGQALRVRKIGNKTEFAFKGKNKSETLKVEEEIEVNTTNFADTKLILEKAGFVKTYEHQKRRITYKLGQIKFDLDYPALEKIPPLMEIEAPSEKEVIEYVQKLGFSIEQTSNMTARELEKHYYQNGK